MQSLDIEKARRDELGADGRGDWKKKKAKAIEGGRDSGEDSKQEKLDDLVGRGVSERGEKREGERKRLKEEKRRELVGGRSQQFAEREFLCCDRLAGLSRESRNVSGGRSHGPLVVTLGLRACRGSS